MLIKKKFCSASCEYRALELVLVRHSLHVLLSLSNCRRVSDIHVGDVRHGSSAKEIDAGIEGVRDRRSR